MRMKLSVVLAPLLPVLLIIILVGTYLNAEVRAAGPQKSAKKPAKTKTTPKKKTSTASKSKVAKKKTTAKSSSKKKVARSSRSRRSRARARYLARLRVLKARDQALRNIATANISNDNVAGEDMQIRKAAIDALKGRSGTVVVMDPTNGRVFTIVNQKMALGSPVKPCSTIKLVVGLAALHEGVFDPNQDVAISAKATMNLTDAMARSNNPVFQVLGRMLGFERVTNYAQNFGLGEQTGINHTGESDGFIPEEGQYETGHMSSHGDGFGVTAMQLATFTSAIANGGYLYVPQTPKTPGDSSYFQPILKRRIDMSAEDRLRLMAGMMGAVNYGTAKLAHNPRGQVAGKTGTCTGKTDKLGLFTSFSSVDDPRVVVTVITSGYQEAGRRAAEIAGRVYAEIAPRFFSEKYSTPASAGVELTDTKDNK